MVNYDNLTVALVLRWLADRNRRWRWAIEVLFARFSPVAFQVSCFVYTY